MANYISRFNNQVLFCRLKPQHILDQELKFGTVLRYMLLELNEELDIRQVVISWEQLMIYKKTVFDIMHIIGLNIFKTYIKKLFVSIGDDANKIEKVVKMSDVVENI